MTIFFLSVAAVKKNSAEGNTMFVCNERKGSEEQVDAHLQWQLNLLTHIENVQNEVTSRMDLIEKEVDGNFLTPRNSIFHSHRVEALRMDF